MKRPDKKELIKYKVDYSADTDFSAHGRLLQSKWRESKGYPFAKYGNFLPSEFAKSNKVNFLSDKVRCLAQYELLRKGVKGKLIKEDRMWENLLSSQPLCFNLFGELHFDLKMATKYFKKLFPERIGEVTDVLFEHSPGRDDIRFTGDHSAFDVFVEYKRGDVKGFVGIEVKYAESLKEEQEKSSIATFTKHENEYRRLTTNEIFVPGAIDSLKHAPLSQIWRDHLLSIATKSIYDEGFFVFLYPSQNDQCSKGVKLYSQYLISSDESLSGFYPRYLEEFIEMGKGIFESDLYQELKIRYLGEA